MTKPPPEPLLTVRTALVLLLAAAAGSVAGSLSYLANHSVPTGVLVGCGGSGAAVALFHQVLGR